MNPAAVENHQEAGELLALENPAFNEFDGLSASKVVTV